MHLKCILDLNLTDLQLRSEFGIWLIFDGDVHLIGCFAVSLQSAFVRWVTDYFLAGIFYEEEFHYHCYLLWQISYYDSNRIGSLTRSSYKSQNNLIG